MRELDEAVSAIGALRRSATRVHCITNAVAQEWTANVLLACGAIPSMTVSPREAADFTAASDALLVNLGTLDEPRERAIGSSLEIAGSRGMPVILDPVKCEMSPHRAALARSICDRLPVVLKANAAEAQLLSGVGVACRIVTGQTDRIEFDGGSFEVANGEAVMDRVVAMGCALGALVAALCPHSSSPPVAALGALVWFGVAAQTAAARTGGPGSFRPAFVDCLAQSGEAEILKGARVR